MKVKSYDQGDLYLGHCLDVMGNLEDYSVDLVFGSPPYGVQRSYGELDFNLSGQDWVDWMAEIVEESLIVCKGLVAFVVGHGNNEKPYKWDATPALLCADLHRKGINLREPKWFHRHGIPGSGGPDDLRKDIEWIICATNGGKLPWSNNKACGHPPKYPPGGEMSYRTKDGTRRNKVTSTSGNTKKGCRRITKKHDRKVTDIVNPGNVIKCSVGRGHLGSNLAHENEAPFPEKLATFFILTFCPPGGTVFDPFGGSGTTATAAIKTGRKFITCDNRESQWRLMKKRLYQIDTHPHHLI